MRDFLVGIGCGEYVKVLPEHGVHNIATLCEMEELGKRLRPVRQG